MAKMFVTILNLDTEACQAESVSKRKIRFENVLRDANAFIARKMSIADNGRPLWNIFAAPEYSFAQPLDHDNHGPGDVRHLSEGSKVSLERWLKQLSTQHSRTLIFPGSIAWKKSMNRNLDTYLKTKESLSDKFDKSQATQHFQGKAQTRQQKAVGSINASVADFMGGNFDHRVAGNMTEPTYYEYDGTDWWFETTHPSGVMRGGKRMTKDYGKAKLKTVHQAPSSREKLNELGGGKVTHMARNTSLIYLNGKKMAKYHKAQDYHEVLDTKGDTVYVPGNSVPVFDVAGLTFGVEICLDHVYESLGTRLPMAKVPDVIVLMSAKVRFDSNNLPVNGAMVIHACSNQSWSFVGLDGVPGSNCTKESPSSVTDYAIYSFDV